MRERSFAALMAGAVLAGVGALTLVQQIDVPGVSKFVRPSENGVGTRCAEGDESACKQLCLALSDVSTIKCVDHLSRVFPRVKDGARIRRGGDIGTGNPHPPGGPPGGGPPPAPPGPPNKPPPPPTRPPPAPPRPIHSVEHTVCHLNVLGIRVCVKTP